MKIGAFDYVQKPFEIEEMELKVEKAIEHRRLKHEIEYLRHTQQDIYDFDRIVGASGALQSVLAIVKKVAKSNTTVLIRGETGTGKELIAGAIHHNSLRAGRNFVKVNCAALQENLLESELFGHEKGAFTGADKQRVGRFEQADGGTLFLDEVGDMSAEHAGQDPARPPGARVRAPRRHAHAARRRPGHRGDQPQPAADGRQRAVPRGPLLPPERRLDRDAAAARAQGRHRAAGDVLPAPLRRRAEEARRRASPDAQKLLMRYNWPGNIRELENAIERAVLLTEGPQLTSIDLRLGELSTTQAVGRRQPGGQDPADRHPARGDRASGDDRSAKMSNWVQKDAAELLAISPRVMNYKIKTLGIDYSRGRRPMVGVDRELSCVSSQLQSSYPARIGECSCQLQSGSQHPTACSLSELAPSDAPSDTSRSAARR